MCCLSLEVVDAERAEAPQRVEVLLRAWADSNQDVDMGFEQVSLEKERPDRPRAKCSDVPS